MASGEVGYDGEGWTAAARRRTRREKVEITSRVFLFSDKKLIRECGICH